MQVFLSSLIEIVWIEIDGGSEIRSVYRAAGER